MEREDEKDCLSKKEKLRKIQKENFEDIFFLNQVLRVTPFFILYEAISSSRW